MTVGELMSRMTAKEFRSWQRFYAACPFGPLRGDMQAWLAGRCAPLWKKPLTLGDAVKALALKSAGRRRRPRRAPPPGPGVARRLYDQWQARQR